MGLLAHTLGAITSDPIEDQMRELCDPTRAVDIVDRPNAHERRGAGQRGAAMVEMALILPALVMLLLGTVSSGLALNDNMQLTHATREGARYGATVPDDESFSSGTWAENVQVVVVERFGGDLQQSDVCVALVSGSPGVPLSGSHTTKADGTGCYDDSSSGVTDVRVQVVGAKESVIETGFYTYDLDLSAQAAAKHESNG